MPKKTLILLIFLAVVTSFLLFLAFKTETVPFEQSKPVTNSIQKKIISYPSPVPKTATVSFSPPVLYSSGAKIYTINLTVDAGTTPITGVQTDIQFDPKVISDFSLSTPATNFFGANGDYLVLFKDVNAALGTANYAIAITPQSAPKMGSGIVGTISFSINPSANLSPSSTISFGSHTLVTKPGVTDSVLKNTTPLTIYLNAAQTASPANQ